MPPDATAHDDLYDRIKEAALIAPCRRGERIDVLGIADRHRVSVTPVRDVLFRLVGERLVSPHSAGGFQILLPDARDLQDLYAWNGHHLLAAIHLLPDPVMRRAIRPVAALRGQDPAEAFARLAIAIGNASGSNEFVRHITGANDRLRRARVAEAQLFADRAKEFASIVKTNGFDVRNNVRRRILAYHRRRVENAAQIAGLLG